MLFLNRRLQTKKQRTEKKERKKNKHFLICETKENHFYNVAKRSHKNASFYLFCCCCFDFQQFKLSFIVK